MDLLIANLDFSGLRTEKSEDNQQLLIVPVKDNFKTISKKDSIITALNNFKETNQVWSPTVNDTLIAVNIIPRKVKNIVINNLFKE